jgi:hypothetical protein
MKELSGEMIKAPLKGLNALQPPSSADTMTRMFPPFLES